MVPPLSTKIGHMGIGPNADAILNGTFNIPEGTDPYAARLIWHLRQPQILALVPPISPAITTETHIYGWQHVREQTSSGPSGIHFGHFIAGTTNPQVADFDATMTNIPVATAATAWDDPTTGNTTILLFHQGLWFGDKLQ